MNTFKVGDEVKIVGDLVNSMRPETLIGMTGVISDVREFIEPLDPEYIVQINNLTERQGRYHNNPPFFYDYELEKVQ